jgi:carnitine-CoA ligase
MVADELRSWRVVPDRLRYWARTDPDRPFFRCGGDWYSFGAADRLTDAIAGGLAVEGIEHGDRVAVILPNREEYILSILALAKLGAVQVPVNVFLKGDFLRHQLRDSQAKAVIGDLAGLAEVARVRGELPDLRFTVACTGTSPAPAGAISFEALRDGSAACPRRRVEARDTLAIMYTSGTTGASKGCVLSHGYYLYLPWGWFDNDWYRTDDRLLTAMPLFHIGGQGMTLMAALLGGMPMTVLTSFSASGFLAACRAARATTAFGVGPMAMAVLATPRDPADREHDLRLSIFPPMAPAARERWAERFGIPVATEGYGQTECNPIAQSPVTGQGKQPGSLGRPCPHLDVRLVDGAGAPVAPGDPGEVVVRPREPMVMFDGYWRNPAATVAVSRELWHHTGDCARFDDEGYLVFVDRLKDSMRRRGENISSVEIEAVLLRHPKIAAVATHAVPAPLGEDDVKAWIVTTPGETFTPAELHGFFAAELPYFAVPRYVEFTEQLPVNALGRVQKFTLREADNAGAWDFEALGLTIGADRRR